MSESIIALTGTADTLGVDIRIGDTVTITSWGAPVRLVDTGRRAIVTGVNRVGNLVLDGAPFGHDTDPIAGGRGVRPGYVCVARRDGGVGHEGNRPRPVAEDRDFYDNLHDSIPSDVPATAWDSDSASKGA